MLEPSGAGSLRQYWPATAAPGLFKSDTLHAMLKKSVLLVLSCLLAASANARINLDQVREAARARDLATLAQISEQSTGDPLEMYPRFYLLSTQINQTDSADANQFIQRYSPSPLAERFTNEWLKELARRQSWAEYEALYPRLDSPNTEQICFKQQAALLRGDASSIPNHKNLWFNAKALPGTCNMLFDTLFANGLLSEEDAWWRIRQAFSNSANSSNSQPDLARQLASRVGNPPELGAKSVSAVHNAPEKAIAKINTNSRAGRELWLYAVEKIGRKNPQQAASLISSASWLAPADQQFAWQQLGLLAARRLLPEASRWLERAHLNDISDDDREWAIRAALRVSDWKMVEQRINALPAHLQQGNTWRYWKARALLARNQSATANALWLGLSDQLDFYGLLAREEIGQILSAPTPVYKANTEDLKAIHSLPGVLRALQLNAQGWRTEATREWNWAMKGLSDQQLLAAAELASRNRMYDRSIYSAMRPKTMQDFTLRFPQPYRDSVEPAAKAYGLDPAWVFGLIRQESRFIADIRSSAGATGLMQLMPATAQWVAKRLGMSDFTMADMSDPEINPQLGSYYLAYWNERFGGNPVLATAGYNAGPGNAAKWRDDSEMEAAIYIETIPFSETRDYVKAVLANASHYSHYYNGSPSQILKRLPPVAGKNSVSSKE